MATLVLTTAGNALGGPIGGAIGALIGQSIDQQLLGSPRRGPRVGDLAVQTSTYGTQIPRIYGAMRVAGSVVWSTDLIESEQMAGAKGQPDVSYSYSVSFAVALSSRAVKSVERIWADGKLLRGAAGDFKVSTTFRFYHGSEDQAIDPLIGSIEGIGSTPAYRGVALAVFENLQLAEFGNRIPFLTFEVVADEAPQTVGAVLEDVSAGLIQSDVPQQLVGFAAYGASLKTAVQPLVDSFGIEMFDDGAQLRGPSGELAVAISEDQLGNSSDSGKVARTRREQLPVSAVPAALRLTYYDPARDYQTGESRAVSGEETGTEAQQELPAALSASDAKSLAHQMLARAWGSRDKLTLRLAPAHLALEPGTKLDLPFNPSLWTVEKCTIDGFIPVVELRPATSQTASVAGDGGRFVPNDDLVAGPLSLALLDIPNVFTPGANERVLLVAASSPTRGWKRNAVQITFAGQGLTTEAAGGKAVLGTAATVLGSGSPDLADDRNSVDVQLVDPDQWITSCDDAALAGGANLAILGSELFQFGNASALGGGRFRLTRLLRGRAGTEWACDGHLAGETFCLIDSRSLQSVALPSWSVGALVDAEARGARASITFVGESVRPPSPVNLSAAAQPNGDLVLSWIRRSRTGFAWVDEIDAPLGESREEYRVDISGASGSVSLTCDEPTVTVSAADLASLGSGAAQIEVRQIGDLAASRPALLSITLV